MGLKWSLATQRFLLFFLENKFCIYLVWRKSIQMWRNFLPEIYAEFRSVNKLFLVRSEIDSLNQDLERSRMRVNTLPVLMKSRRKQSVHNIFLFKIFNLFIKALMFLSSKWFLSGLNMFVKWDDQNNFLTKKFPIWIDLASLLP